MPKISSNRDHTTNPCHTNFGHHQNQGAVTSLPMCISKRAAAVGAAGARPVTGVILVMVVILRNSRYIVAVPDVDTKDIGAEAYCPKNTRRFEWHQLRLLKLLYRMIETREYFI